MVFAVTVQGHLVKSRSIKLLIYTSIFPSLLVPSLDEIRHGRLPY